MTPFHYTYLNIFAGKYEENEKKFENDYWGISTKKLVSKIPGGSTKLGSFASALFLIKENYKLKDKDLSQILEKCGIERLDFLTEANSNWFLSENKQAIPGVYRIRENHKIDTS